MAQNRDYKEWPDFIRQEKLQQSAQGKIKVISVNHAALPQKWQENSEQATENSG